MTADRPVVLFVCVHNAGRSQMAAGWLALPGRESGRDPVRRFRASGPGEPACRPGDARDRDRHRQRAAEKLTTESVERADVVITMGCGDTCPVFPGKRYEDWEVTDPAGQPIEVVRQVRDDIRARVEALVSELLGSAV